MRAAARYYQPHEVAPLLQHDPRHTGGFGMLLLTCLEACSHSLCMRCVTLSLLSGVRECTGSSANLGSKEPFTSTHSTIDCGS